MGVASFNMCHFIKIILLGVLYQEVSGKCDLYGDTLKNHRLKRSQFQSPTNSEGNNEIVGLGGLARIHAFEARAIARARAHEAHVRSRARLHRPLLLQVTPADISGEIVGTEVEQNLNKQEVVQPPIPTINNQNFESVSTPHQRSNYDEDKPVNYQEGYSNMPEIYIHNVDNSEEAEQNGKPGFSIIPTNWKPPPQSNLYLEGYYRQPDGQEPILAVLPGKWTSNYDCGNNYYEKYEVVPISYNIPEDAYARSAESEREFQDPAPKQLTDLKKQMREFEVSPKADQRAAEPTFKKFHHSSHAQSHAFSHEHVIDFQKPFPSKLIKHQTSIQHSNFGLPQINVPSYSESHASFAQTEAQGHHKSFSPYSESAGGLSGHHTSFSPYSESAGGLSGHQFQIDSGAIHKIVPQGHQITINKQKTTVIVPPGSGHDVQIAQVSGTSNAVSQSQSSHKAGQDAFATHGSFSASKGVQTAQVFGTQNSVSQSQRTSEVRPFNASEPENLVGAPFLINFPRRENVWRSHGERVVTKRFVGQEETNIYRHNKILKKSKRNKNRKNGVHSVSKRSVPLLRLVTDPNTNLDVPKTLENLGTVVRNSFDNKRAPMYHIKKMVGSTKDAFLSVLRIPPQNLVVPSKYEIAEREGDSLQSTDGRIKISKRGGQRLEAINPALKSRDRASSSANGSKSNSTKEHADAVEAPAEVEDPFNFSDTYNKIGSMLRESVRSGQETLNHIGDMYHNARKALAATQHSFPRVIMSGMRIPAVQHPSPPAHHNDKVLVIAPKILQLKQEGVGAPRYYENIDDMVGVKHVMDSLGFANPEATHIGLQRIVIHPQNVQVSRERRPNVVRNSNVNNVMKYHVLVDDIQPDNVNEDIHETLAALDNARESVGARNLQDFIVQMKNGISGLFKSTFNKAKDPKVADKVQEKSGGGNRYKFSPSAVSTPKKKSKIVGSVQDPELVQRNSVNSSVDEEETVGADLLLPQRLLKPFMGQPSKKERRKFFEEYGDSFELNEEDENGKDKEKQANSSSHNHIGNSVVGAINPIIFNKTFAANETGMETTTKKDDNISDDSEDFSSEEDVVTSTPVAPTTKKSAEMEASTESAVESNSTESVGASMTMGKKLLTPFMGKFTKKEITVFPAGYDDGDGSSDYTYVGADTPEEYDLQVLSTKKPKRNKEKAADNKQNNPHSIDDNFMDQNVL